VKFIPHTRSREAARWFRQEIAAQNTRYRPIVAEQDALAPKRDNPHIEPYVELSDPWQKMTLPGFPKGMRYTVLSRDDETGACSLKVLYEPGYEQPPGISQSEMELFVFSAGLVVGDRTCGPGNYFFVPAGVSMPAMTSPKGAQVLQYCNYGEPSFVESDSDHPDAERDRLATVNACEGMQWSSTNVFRMRKWLLLAAPRDSVTAASDHGKRSRATPRTKRAPRGARLLSGAPGRAVTSAPRR
jgi:hypothetical protein